MIRIVNVDKYLDLTGSKLIQVIWTIPLLLQLQSSLSSTFQHARPLITGAVSWIPICPFFKPSSSPNSLCDAPSSLTSADGTSYLCYICGTWLSFLFGLLIGFHKQTSYSNCWRSLRTWLSRTKNLKALFSHGVAGFCIPYETLSETDVPVWKCYQARLSP